MSSLKQENQECASLLYMHRSSVVKVTILASEWGSSKEGLSIINREMAIQLAKCPEAEITFFVPQCSEQEKKEALNHNINIIEAKRRPGYEELEWLSFPPEHLQIDVIVGHGVRLGRQAQIIRDSHKCKWFHVVHTDLEEPESSSNPISEGDEKHKIEVELCEMADHVVGIGPKLTEAFRSYLRWCKKDKKIIEFTPGVFDEFKTVRQAPHEGKHCSVLVFGHALERFDIAAKAVGSLPDAHLLFIGAQDGRHKEIAKRFSECGICSSRLKIRGHGTSGESLKRFFCEADLALCMPSRTENFGLTGLEALSAGLPVLVSKNTGFGEALSKVPFGASYVIDSEDPEIWAAAIKMIWGKDRQSRLEEAETLRTCYEKKYRWTKQSKDLLDSMISIVHGRNFHFYCQ